MGDQYSVHKSALRTAAGYIAEAGEKWVVIGSGLGNAKLASDDLGIIGEKANIVAKYNAGVDQVWQRISDGVGHINMMALALEAVAASYGRADHRAINELKKAMQ
ncbi:hypothetical protein [Actinomadura xylanilytica]|uniref:hypothetical protein n=1 Tax=Actinomadura xylanilytica TaxID=887459 RepID=UPI00255A8F7F|nr:hypothetical protein [Actinomadura xylanilytica]MDL4772602.1 hypothetical protein [Actinomadura xylanilytica]